MEVKNQFRAFDGRFPWHYMDFVHVKPIYAWLETRRILQKEMLKANGANRRIKNTNSMADLSKIKRRAHGHHCHSILLHPDRLGSVTMKPTIHMKITITSSRILNQKSAPEQYSLFTNHF
jgi:hypothetical protein